MKLYFQNARPDFGRTMSAYLNAGNGNRIVETFRVQKIQPHDYGNALLHLIAGCGMGGELSEYGVGRSMAQVKLEMDSANKTRGLKIMAKSVVHQARLLGFMNADLIKLSTEIMGLVTEDLKAT